MLFGDLGFLIRQKIGKGERGQSAFDAGGGMIAQGHHLFRTGLSLFVDS